MRMLSIIASVALLALASSPIQAQSSMSDAQVRQQIIRQSIASYSGSCPCPYNTDRAGRRCGGRSAYSRPGGASPRCYPSDVSSAEVAAWRRANSR